jgi:hypothetical protein
MGPPGKTAGPLIPAAVNGDLGDAGAPAAPAAPGMPAAPGAGAPPGLIAPDPQWQHRITELSYSGLMEEQSFDPLRSKRFHGQLLRRAAMYAALSAAADVVVTIFLLLAAIASRSLGPLEQVRIFVPLFLLGAFILYLVLPVPGLLCQWSQLYGSRARSGDIAFTCIRQAMERHAVPHDSLEPQRRWPPSEGSRNYLELRRGVFAGYISCFPHGLDLYVGWTFWIYMSPLRLLILKIGRKAQDWSGRGNEMYQTLRYESTRATVAAIHACTLEGIDVAIRVSEVVPDAAAPAPAAAPADPVAGTASRVPAGT